jgi:uncharacterized delta-60 repeat protein
MSLQFLFGIRRRQPSRTACGHGWSRTAVLLGACCLALAWLGSAWAADGALDPSFNPGAGAQKIPIVRGKIDFTDGSGRTMFYGFFTSVNGVNRSSIAVLTSGGGLDPFNPAINGEVRRVLLLPDGKFLIGGVFSVGSWPTTYYNLARLNSDGSLDTSFTQTFDYYGAVNGLAVQSDGKIMVGGYSLAPYGQTTTYHLVRLQANGGLDTGYPNQSAPAGYVSSVKVLAGDLSRILGTLPRTGGSHVDYLLVLNSSGVAQSNIGDEMVDGPILNLAQQSSGKLIIGGQFQNVLGVARNRVARFNADMTLDTSFNFGAGPNGAVTQVTVQADDKVVLAGNFDSFNGTPCGYLVRLNADGPVDAAFNPGGSGADDRIFNLADNGGVGWFIFGAFRAYNGAARNGVALLNLDGALTDSYAALTVNSTALGTVYALARQSDGKILIGGDFTGYQGKFHSGFARLNPDGSLDTAFKGGVDGTYVKGLAVQPDGKILLAGYFGAAQHYACTSLARLSSNSSFDTTFKPVVTKLDGSVSDLKQAVPLANGQIMVAGHLRKAGGLTRTALVRLFSDGLLDTSFDAQITITSGTNVRANRVAEVGGKYVVAGYVTFEGLARGFLTRLTDTGALDPTFGPTAPPTPSPNVNITAGEVMDLALQKDQRIMVSGNFSEIIDGSWSRPQRGRIARFTADGFLDPTFTTNIGANNVIEAMALQPNGKILIGGSFTRYNLPDMGQPDNRNRIARILSNGDLDASFNPGAGLAEPSSAAYKVSAYALKWLSSGKVLIGGYFSLYNGISRNQLAQAFAGPADFSPATLLLLLMDT